MPVRRDNCPGLHALAEGIDRDRLAVIAGLTRPWSSGVVEGHVNRIKMPGRQMSGEPASVYVVWPAVHAGQRLRA